MNFPFNEIEFPQFRVFVILPKKPMATHQASINIQEPTKFKLEATRRRIILPAWTELDEPSNSSAIRKPSSTNLNKNSPSSQNSNQNLQQSNPKSRDLTMADSTAQTTSSTVHDAAIHGLKVIYGLIFQFSSAYQVSETETLKHDTICIFSELLNFRCQTSSCRIPLIQNLSVLAHKPMKTP